MMRVVPAVLLLFATLLPAQVRPKSAPDILVITNVNIVDTRTGSVQPRLTVLIKNGRMASIAKLGIVGSSPRYQIINGSGKYLIPGLWDMHVHSAGGPAAPWDTGIILPLYIVNGITGIRDMGGDLDVLQARQRQIEDGELIGPRMFYSGPFLDGGTPGDYKIAVNTPDEGRQAVDLLKSKGVDFIKVLSSVPRDTYFAIAAEAKQDKLPFVGHVPMSVSSAEASAAGQKSIEHLSGVLESCSGEEDSLRAQRLQAADRGDAKGYYQAGMKALTTYDSEKAWRLFSGFTDNVTWQVPTLVWWHANSELGNSALASDEHLKYVPAWARKEWDPAKLQEQLSADDRADSKKVFAQLVTATGTMKKAGVHMMAGTDSPDPNVIPGFSLHDELEFLVRAGFTPFQALQSATFNPALFLTQLLNYGTVEKNKRADLVLLDANPLADIRNTRKIAAVIMNGRYYSRRDLDAMLAQAAALAEASTQPSPPTPKVATVHSTPSGVPESTRAR